MFFQSSRGICRRRSVIWSNWYLLILILAAPAQGQTPETVLARVNDKPITQKQVDDSIAAQIYPLQQQLYAIRKAALENLVTRMILEREAAGRNVSVEELRKQLTQGEIKVTAAQVEEAYKQNASFFASMSPDEAREVRFSDVPGALRTRRTRYSATIQPTETSA